MASQAAISLENTRLYSDLEEREAKVRRLVDSNIIGIYIWDFQGRIIEANEAFLEIVGYSREDLISGRLHYPGLTPPEWDDVSEQARAVVKATGTAKVFEKEYLRKDGSRVPILLGGATFGEGRNQGVAFVLDLTERKRAEENLRESERRYREAQAELAHVNRVTAMGQLTASIAHEVNQPIAAAVTNAEAGLRFLGRDPPDLEEVRKGLARIIKDASRAGNVIGRIRDLIKKTPPQKDWVDINDAIIAVVDLTRSELVRNGISLQTRFAEGMPPIHGDRVQLQQVFVNLIVNAIEAMSGVSGAARELWISTEINASNGALVAVKDFRSRIGSGQSRAPLRRILHDQAQWHGDGTIDLPLDHRSTRGTHLGRGKRTAGRHVSAHSSLAGRAVTRQIMDAPAAGHDAALAQRHRLLRSRDGS